MLGNLMLVLNSVWCVFFSSPTVARVKDKALALTVIPAVSSSRILPVIYMFPFVSVSIIQVSSQVLGHSLQLHNGGKHPG